MCQDICMEILQIKPKKKGEISLAEVAEGFTALWKLHVARMVVGSSPKLPPMLVDMSASM